MFSESNNDEASDLANSVLPTPVGPKNKKLPIGRLGSLYLHALSLQHLTQDQPLYLALRHVHVRYHLSLIIFLSVSTNLETGIPVHWLTISPLPHQKQLRESCVHYRLVHHGKLLRILLILF